VPLNPHGAGTGALMRAFPLALAFLDAPDEEARSVVLHQAALTHHNPAAGWGAWVAVAMMRTAIVGRDPFDRLPIVLAEMTGDVRAQFAPLLSPAWTPEGDPHRNGAVWGCLAQAVWALRSTTSFEAALVTAVSLGDDADTVACVTGALAGARYGVQAIPSRWATYVHGHVDSPIGRIDYRASDLQRIAMHLIGGQDRADTPPDERAGPTEVAPGLHAADLLGASGVPTDWAVVSLCRTGDRFLDHPNRRQVFLIDQEGDHNPGLAHVVPDAVAAVQAFIAEGLNVVVHCHGGRSRTGLVLKAWKMATDGCSERAAHEWLAERWGRYQDYNRSFVQYLRSIE
jgi:ADP-ribosyl-[dinitrogen reductase] hydrolase